jgi:hypothetical protein
MLIPEGLNRVQLIMENLPHDKTSKAGCPWSPSSGHGAGNKVNKDISQ